MLNYALGYSNETGKTVGPTLFYWLFYFWLPVWGPVLSLMYLGRSSFHKRDVHMDADVLSPLAGDASYAGSASHMTVSIRKTLSDSIGTSAGPAGAKSTMSTEEPRTTVYRPPDYPSALFSRDSAYQYDDGDLEDSTNDSFDAPLLPVSVGADNSTLVDYYDAFLQNSPNPSHHPISLVSGDTTRTTTSGFPSHPSFTTESENSSVG